MHTHIHQPFKVAVNSAALLYWPTVAFNCNSGNHTTSGK